MQPAKRVIICVCGNPIETSNNYAWCLKCGKKSFSTPRDAFKDKLNHYYVYGAIASVMTFLTYIFIEMIAKPLLL